MLFAPRTVAAKKFGFVRWALTLAPLRRTLAWGIGHRGVGCLGLGLTAASAQRHRYRRHWARRFSWPLAVLPVLPAGSPSPPPPCRGAALGATVPSLRMGGSEELLAPLEQTPPPSRPTSPLTGPRLAASLEWAQGSCELPTAKPRVRSPYLRPEAPSLIPSALVVDPSLHCKADPAGFQATTAGATSPKRTHFGLAPRLAEKVVPSLTVTDKETLMASGGRDAACEPSRSTT